MEFKDLIDYCHAQAIANKLHPTDEAVWRKFCREYSVLFSTDLETVKKLNPMDVILEIYEHQLEEIDVEENMEQILDIIYTLEDPEYEKYKRDELKDFIKEAEEEEEKRIASGRPIHRAMDDEVSIKNSIPKETLLQKGQMPRSGGINLAYLEKEDKEESGDF